MGHIMSAKGWWCHTAVLCLLLGSILDAKESSRVPYTVDSLLSNKTRLIAGYSQIDNRNYSKLGIGFNFGFGKLTQVDIEPAAYFPAGAGEPSVYVNVKEISFEIDNLVGFQWGRLTDLTIAQGGLMDRFDSGSGVSGSDYNPHKAGTWGFVELSALHLEGFLTSRGLYGGYGAYKLGTIPVLDVPMKVGAAYIRDPLAPLTSVESGYSTDVSLLLSGDMIVLYSEYARLNNHGDGTSIGLKGNVLDIVNYRLAYRMNNADFLPGYFGPGYEQSAPVLPTEKSTSTVAGIGSAWLGGMVKTDIQAEFFPEYTVMITGVGIKPILGMAAVAHYTKPFGSTTAFPSLEAQAYIPMGMLAPLIGIKQVYGPITDTSYTLGISVNLI